MFNRQLWGERGGRGPGPLTGFQAVSVGPQVTSVATLMRLWEPSPASEGSFVPGMRLRKKPQAWSRPLPTWPGGGHGWTWARKCHDPLDGQVPQAHSCGLLVVFSHLVMTLSV